MIDAVSTYTATVYAGLRERQSGRLHKLSEVRRVLSDYCDRVGLCVTLTPTEFIYTNGGEPGVAVGLINYPRFPSSPEEIRTHALRIAEALMEACAQMRVSVVFPDETLMISSASAPCDD